MKQDHAVCGDHACGRVSERGGLGWRVEVPEGDEGVGVRGSRHPVDEVLGEVDCRVKECAIFGPDVGLREAENRPALASRPR